MQFRFFSSLLFIATISISPYTMADKSMLEIITESSDKKVELARLESEMVKGYERYPTSIYLSPISNLAWQDNEDILSNMSNFEVAEGYCKNLILENIRNWRLPVYEELVELYKEKNEMQFESSEFHRLYWTTSIFDGPMYKLYGPNRKRGVGLNSRDYNTRCVADL